MTDTTHPFNALMEITARPPVVFVRGAGSWLWDDARKRYLDFVQGWAVNALGHSPPAVAEALAETLRPLRAGWQTALRERGEAELALLREAGFAAQTPARDAVP